ncbi:MAG TPA: hypothetical protein VFA54_03760 [Bryobacterales bacterium]|jgi:hypothetical protein|nr:hypothetical protein [Bryobacterales bacterium]
MASACIAASPPAIAEGASGAEGIIGLPARAILLGTGIIALVNPWK